MELMKQKKKDIYFSFQFILEHIQFYKIIISND